MKGLWHTNDLYAHLHHDRINKGACFLHGLTVDIRNQNIFELNQQTLWETLRMWSHWAAKRRNQTINHTNANGSVQSHTMDMSTSLSHFSDRTEENSHKSESEFSWQGSRSENMEKWGKNKVSRTSLRNNQRTVISANFRIPTELIHWKYIILKSHLGADKSDVTVILKWNAERTCARRIFHSSNPRSDLLCKAFFLSRSLSSIDITPGFLESRKSTW